MQNRPTHWVNHSATSEIDELRHELFMIGKQLELAQQEHTTLSLRRYHLIKTVDAYEKLVLEFMILDDSR